MDDGTFKSELGLLGLKGYRVGDRGRIFSERKKVLDQVWALPITPYVKEKVENWEEWGGPKSSTRCQKLITTLSTFANRPGMKQAAKDWQHDLDYVRSTLCKDEMAGEPLS